MAASRHDKTFVEDFNLGRPVRSVQSTTAGKQKPTTVITSRPMLVSLIEEQISLHISYDKELLLKKTKENNRDTVTS